MNREVHSIVLTMPALSIGRGRNSNVIDADEMRITMWEKNSCPPVKWNEYHILMSSHYLLHIIMMNVKLICYETRYYYSCGTSLP